MEHSELLIRLLIAHVIGDFLLQPKSWITHRQTHGYKSHWLYLHALLQGILAYLFLADWSHLFFPTVIAVTHLGIDLWKSYQDSGGRISKAVAFCIDQALHIGVIVIVWVLCTHQERLFYEHLLEVGMIEFVIILAYLVVLWPFSIFIKQAMHKWTVESDEEGLQDAGKWIGRLERVLVLTFVLLGQWQAIGFLIAAKSVFRFNELKKSEDQQKTEYILIGTLLSFTLTILLGLGIRWLL